MEVFPQVRIETLPSDYVRASESLNLGIPICESAANSPLGKALLKLMRDLTNQGQTVATSTPRAINAPPPSRSARKAGLFGWLKT